MEHLTPSDIGQALKKLRVTQKLEQADVGLYIGVSDRTVRNIEKGASGTKTGTVLSAANELGLLLKISEMNTDRVLENNSDQAATLIKIGNLIREARKKQKIRQDDLAAIVGVQHSVLGRIERGDASVAVGTMLNVLNELGLRLYSQNYHNPYEEQ